MNKVIVSLFSALVLSVGCSAGSMPDDTEEVTDENQSPLAFYFCEINAAHTALTGRCNKSGYAPSSCSLPLDSDCPAGQAATYRQNEVCGMSAPTTIQGSTKRCY